MPTARAPMPILRKLPAEVPTRWPPTVDCAQAPEVTVAQHANPASRMAPAIRIAPVLEVIVDPQPPARRRSVDAGMTQHRVALELRRGHVLPVALLRSASGARVHALDHLGIQDVLAHEAQVQTLAPEIELLIEAQV